MICCKIIANFSNGQGSFSKLCELLAKKGDFLWDNGVMYFADTEHDTTERQIMNCVKKAGYTKVFVDTYDAKHEPHEDERVKGWIADKLTKIYYQQYEHDSQEVFRNIDHGLDALNEEIDELTKKAAEEAAKAESKNTEDKK